MVSPPLPGKLAMNDKGMNMRALASAGLIAGLALFLSAAQAQDSEQPDPADRITDRGELDHLIKDQTFYGLYSPSGKPWSEYQASDGRTAYREENCTYAGHWWIEAGEVCYRYDAFNDGKPACFAMFHRGDQLAFYLRGLSGEWYLNAYTTGRRPGNPDNMPVEGQTCVGV